MKYGSVCSGIEAATVAWHGLNWSPQWFAEVNPFCSEVLAQRWPHVPNLGDMTKIQVKHGTIDLLVGGTPCQSFSVAGLRKGLADPRGNLALEFLRIARDSGARWLVWENVPGVLSSNEGRDFSAFVGALVELGYGFTYRVLDAQHFGVPQRRRRVFVVGYLGDWRPAAAVLFERESLSGNLKTRKESRKDITGTLGDGIEGCEVIPLPFDTTQITSPANRSNPQHGDPCPTLSKTGHVPSMAFKVQGLSTVRRITPTEAERLQGFPDGHTLINYRKKPAADGPRYKAIGNSMAVPVMRWIGERIAAVEKAI